MPSIAGGITKYLELAVARIYPDSIQSDDRFVTDRRKNCPIRRLPKSRYQYISPIAHQLAAKFQLAPLAICQSLFSSIPLDLEPLSPQLEILCWYTDKGYICFQLTPRSIALWLDYIYTWKAPQPIELKYPVDVDLSIAVYARDRCRSILRLACTEGLISQDISGAWQIPPSQWCDRHSNCGNNRPTADITPSFESGIEDRLIHALMDVLDSICGSRPPDDPRLMIDLAQSWLEFHRHCRIFGDIKRQNPHLAIDRCGLTAISERYLSGW
jgi:hypothetical protein